ncbi:hypothetical protein [Halomicrococcus sp. SG-WS-1]|uniref:hypothetical protein n=1 Tax=Halomicrococcus sp. SG-WS-1 TaxID=3439057 RepID=UPI003F7975DD
MINLLYVVNDLESDAIDFGEVGQPAGGLARMFRQLDDVGVGQPVKFENVAVLVEIQDELPKKPRAKKLTELALTNSNLTRFF